MRRSTLLAVGLVVVLGACSGDDGTAGYLDEVAAAFGRMEADTFAALPRTAEPTRERITGVADARRRALDTLQALVPPEQLGVEHDALVITMRALSEETRRFIADTAGLDADAFADALASTGELALLAESVGRACRALQEKASSMGHTADLRC